MNKPTYLSDRVVSYKRNLLISSSIFVVAAMNQDVGSAFKNLGISADIAANPKAMAYLLFLMQLYFVLQFVFPAIAEAREFRRKLRARNRTRKAYDTFLCFTEFVRTFEIAVPGMYGFIGLGAIYFLYWIS